MYDQLNASLLIKVIHFFQENLTDLILSLLHMFFNRCKKFLYVIDLIQSSAMTGMKVRL